MLVEVENVVEDKVIAVVNYVINIKLNWLVMFLMVELN